MEQDHPDHMNVENNIKRIPVGEIKSQVNNKHDISLAY